MKHILFSNAFVLSIFASFCGESRFKIIQLTNWFVT